jgi:acyl carrier protein
MTALKDRLSDCFCAVFPNRSREELLTASRESIPEWDSLTGVTMLMLLQQEFHLDIDLTELENFDSVQAVYDYVAANATAPEEPHGS